VIRQHLDHAKKLAGSSALTMAQKLADSSSLAIAGVNTAAMTPLNVAVAISGAM
jgi:hypothetical protein